MYTKEAVEVIDSVLNFLEKYPHQFDWFWNASDSVGLLIQCICQIPATELHMALYRANNSYVQVGWRKILNDYIDNNMDSPLKVYIDKLFDIFTYNQLIDIACCIDGNDSLNSYMSMLKGIIVNSNMLLIA